MVPAAIAAPTLSVVGPDSVTWGAEVAVAGSADSGVPTPGATVRIEVLSFPFDAAWVTGATLTADAAGAFRGGLAIIRSSRIRAVVAGTAGDTASP